MLAAFSYAGTTLTVDLDNANEAITLTSQGGGAYVFTSTSNFTGADIAGQLTGNGTNTLTITNALNLTDVGLTDSANNTSISFGTSTGNYVDNFVSVLNNTPGTTTITKATTFSGANLDLTGGNLAVDQALTTLTNGTVTLNGTGTLTILAAGDISSDGAVSLTATGGITTAGDVTTTNDNVTYASKTTLTGPVAIDTGAGAGDIKFQSTLDGGQTLSLTAGTGDVTFSNAVGGSNRLGAITIVSAKDVTAVAVKAASLTQTAGSGTTTLNGPVDTDAAAGVSLTGTNLAVNASITTTNNGTVTFVESGTITIAAAGDISADGAVSLTATGGITTAGDVTTTNDNVTYASKTTLTGPVAINTGAGAGDIKFQSTLDGGQTLSLTAGTGDVTFSNAVGGSNRLGAITIVSAKDVTAAAVKAASLTQTAGSGTTTLNGPVDTDAAAGVSLTGTNLAVNASITTTNNGTVTFVESGTITIAAAGDISSDGAVSLTATGGITTAGDVTTTNDNVTYASKTTLTGPVAIDTGAGAGDIKFQSTLDGAQTLSLTAGTGAITFTGAVGSTSPLAGIKLNSAASTTFVSTAKLDGSAAGAFADGLYIAAGVNNVSLTAVGGSIIEKFTNHGINFVGGSTGSTIANVDILSNGVDGIHVEPGTYTGSKLQANTIGKNQNGILLGGNVLGLLIDANFIGTKSDLVTDIGNTAYGIRVKGNDYTGTVIQSNAIAFNDGDGVYLDAAGGVITNLVIGGNKTAAPSLGNNIFKNDSDGIQADAGNYTGTVIQGNGITKNSEQGILLAAGGGTLGGLKIGAGVGGDGTKFGNLIDSNTLNGILVETGVYTNTVIGGGNEIGNNTLHGIRLQTGNVTQLTIAENAIGTDLATGVANLGNALDGIHVEGGDYTGTVIQSNAIAFNAIDGIRLETAPTNAITNLTIGGNKTAVPSLGNKIYQNVSDGIQADAGGYTGTVIQGNTITANGQQGILLAAGGGTLGGLKIGAGVGGVGAQFGNRIESNLKNGIFVETGDYTGTVIGGGNEIGLNVLNGIELEAGGATTLLITENAIGTWLDGTTIRGNGIHGILVNAGNYSSSTISANNIAFNTVDGIRLEAVGSAITGLGIGGNAIYSNLEDGIHATNGDFTGTVISGNRIDRNAVEGIYLAAAGDKITNLTIATLNEIFKNVSDGIQADNGDYTGTVIQANGIYSNGVEGIYLNAANDRITNLTIGGDKTLNQGNSIFSNLSDGIQADRGDYTGTVIQGNEIGSPSRAFVFGPAANQITFAGDILDSLQVGQRIFLITGGSGVPSNFSITAVAFIGGNTVVTVSDNVPTAAGTAFVGNGENGIFLNAAGGTLSSLTIGGSSANFGNSVFGNVVHGIKAGPGDYQDTKTRTKITWNDIYSNGIDGIRLAAAGDKVWNLDVGPSNSIFLNLSDGIEAERGDYKGTLIRSNAIYSNFDDGIFLDANGDKVTNLTIGGDKTTGPSQGNDIYSNKADGIHATNGSYTGTVIQGNKIGYSVPTPFAVSPIGASALRFAGVDYTTKLFVDQAIFLKTTSPAPAVNSVKRVITYVYFDGVDTFVGISAPIDATTAKGTAVVGNLENGIYLDTAAASLTNLTIGGGVSGASKLANEIYGNTLNGIRVGSGALTGSVIGERNEISLNGTNGIELLGGVQDLLIQRNLIGLKSDNKAGNGNTLAGIYATEGTYTGTKIVLNTIGYNGTNGVELDGVRSLVVGGLPQTNGNTILRNTLAGVLASGVSTGTTIKSNLIDRNKIGVQLDNATGILVGGVTTQEANTITGNTAAGVEATGLLTGSQLYGNSISGSTTGVALVDARDFAVGGLVKLSAVLITGTAGQFDCDATVLKVGDRVTISGIPGGTGSIAGYSDPTTYWIIATNGSTTFTLSATANGSAITTTAGTTTGLTFTSDRVVGNRVFSNTQGLTAQGDSAGTKVLGNSFTGNDVGAQLVGATDLTIGGGDRSNALSRNVFDANPTGIQASGVLTGTKVTGNIIKNGVTGVSLENAQGIVIGGATPLAGNSVESQTTHGVYATGLLTGSKVLNNGIVSSYVGVTLDNAEGLLVDSNSIANNAKTGISAFGELAGTVVSDNELVANKSGIVLDDQIGLGIVHDLTVTGNKITGSLQDGLYATGDLAGSTVTKNTITGSGEAGIALVSAKNLPVTENKVSASAKNGVFATGDLTGSTLSGNEINTSGVAGIALISATNLPVTNNAVNDSVKNGVYATGDLAGSKLSGNTITKSGQSGIVLDSATNLPVTNNKVNDSGKNGVYATGNLAGSSVANNSILRAGEAGISLESARNLPVTANAVTDSVKRGLFATGDSTGTEVKSNVFSKSGTDGAVLDAATNLLVKANEFNDSGDRGLFATGDLFGTKVESNTINRSQGNYATVLDSAKNLQFLTNEINDSLKSGLYATGDLSGTTVDSSTINRTRGAYGAALFSAQNLTVGKTAINDSAGGGLYATGDLSGTAVKESAVNRSQGDFAVVLQSAKNLQFSGNSLADSAKSGLFATGDLTGTKVVSNDISNTGTVESQHVSVSLIDATNLVFGQLGAGNKITGGAGAGLFSSGNLLGTTVKGNLFDGTRSGIVLSNAKNGTFGGAAAGEGNTIIGGGSLPLGQYRDGVFAAGNLAGSTLTGTDIQDAWIGMSLNWVENLAVSKTTITNQQGIGLYAQGASTGTTVTSMGVVRTVAPTLSTSGAVLSSVTGLALSNSEFTGDTTALFVFNESTNTSIVSNTFSGLTTGAGLFSATGLAFGRIGQGNTVTGGQTGGYLSGGMAGTSIAGNSFRATGGTALALVSATQAYVDGNSMTGSAVGLYTTGEAGGTEIVSNIIDGNTTGYSMSATRNLVFGKFRQGNTIRNSAYAGLYTAGNNFNTNVLYTFWAGNTTNVINNASPPVVVVPAS